MGTQDSIIAFVEQEDMLSKQNLAEVVQEHHKTGHSVLSILKDESYLTDDQLLKVVAVSHGIEFTALKPDSIEQVVAHLIPFELADRHTLIPLRVEENRLFVAMASPMDLMVRDQIEMKTGYEVIPVAAISDDIRLAIQCQFDVANETKQAIVSMRLKEGEEAQDSSHELTFGDVSNPITKLVTSIVRGAIDSESSDIHIEPQQAGTRVRYRMDGMLQNALTVPASVQSEVTSHIKIKAGMDISEKRLPQDGHIAVNHMGHEYDLRVSTLPSVGGEKIVIRVLDKDAQKWDMDSVVLDPECNKRLRALAANPYGLLLVTGPTGSGKTTTLYSLLQLVSTPRRNVITVEDPVEYRLDGVTQVQTRPAAGLTFASALRSILRQDPDVILIGEIRDLETAEIAVSAALTGHLVLSTLHTNDAAGAISRLISIGVPPFLLGSALIGSVAQRLVRRVCPKCCRPTVPTPEESHQILGQDLSQDPPEIIQSVGCNDCYQTGYKGRKSIYEILPVSQSIKSLILEGGNDNAIKRQALSEGMIDLSQSAIADVLQGQTTLDEISRIVDMSH
ncbi:MAG: type II/IV secretion system protein [Planctomycetes bacterium]|nr:type II/IV secretion system protein [Planctomycetota bacterium]